MGKFIADEVSIDLMGSKRQSVRYDLHEQDRMAAFKMSGES